MTFSENDKETVLLALCGCSPAVITETVWSLYLESPSKLPSRVVVITTEVGRRAIKAELFDSGVWQRLQQATAAPAGMLRFGPTSDAIRVIPDESCSHHLADIVSGSDSSAAADFILETMRQFTENPQIQLVFSLAGGRKTMTALAAICMTMLGRRGDRLCHVLVNPPFDNPALSPRFYFPELMDYCLDGKVYLAQNVRLVLCDIPYIRTRHLFEERFLALPGTFSRVVAQANEKVESSAEAPNLILSIGKMTCFLDKTPVYFSLPEFVLYWLLASRCVCGEPPLLGQEQLLECYQTFIQTTVKKHNPLLANEGALRGKTLVDDMRKLVNAVSSKIRKLTLLPARKSCCLPSVQRGRYGLKLPVENIVIDVI